MQASLRREMRAQKRQDQGAGCSDVEIDDVELRCGAAVGFSGGGLEDVCAAGPVVAVLGEPSADLGHEGGEALFEVLLLGIGDYGADPGFGGVDDLLRQGEEDTFSGFGNEECEAAVADGIGDHVAQDQGCGLQMGVGGIDLR